MDLDKIPYSYYTCVASAESQLKGYETIAQCRDICFKSIYIDSKEYKFNEYVDCVEKNVPKCNGNSQCLDAVKLLEKRVENDTNTA